MSSVKRRRGKYRNLTETWDSPIIVTTAVQILNTLFSDQKNCIRRMHNLCNSIIIFDEVQAFPVKCTELFNLAVNFLSQFCGTTVVLCSATQPTLASLEENNICKCLEMSGESEKYAKAFKRVEIIDETKMNVIKGNGNRGFKRVCIGKNGRISQYIGNFKYYKVCI